MILKEHHIESLVIFIASLSTINALIFSFLFPEIQTLLLTILTVLLAAIYQIGYNYAKEKIRNKNEEDFSVIENYVEELEEENIIKRKID